MTVASRTKYVEDEGVYEPTPEITEEERAKQEDRAALIAKLKEEVKRTQCAVCEVATQYVDDFSEAGKKNPCLKPQGVHVLCKKFDDLTKRIGNTDDITRERLEHLNRRVVKLEGRTPGAIASFARDFIAERAFNFAERVRSRR